MRVVGVVPHRKRKSVNGNATGNVLIICALSEQLLPIINTCTTHTTFQLYLTMDMLGEILVNVGSSTQANPALFPIKLSMMILLGTTPLGDVSHMMLVRMTSCCPLKNTIMKTMK